VKRKFLAENRSDFYHIRRGLRIDARPALVRGDDYRDVFFCEGHVHWMSAYWQRLSAKQEPKKVPGAIYNRTKKKQ